MHLLLVHNVVHLTQGLTLLNNIHNTVEPRFNEGARDWKNVFALSRFFFIYLAMTGVKKIVRYTEDFVVSRFHCICFVVQYISDIIDINIIIIYYYYCENDDDDDYYYYYYSHKVSARDGELGIIPGSMGARSYIVRGKGNPESFHR